MGGLKLILSWFPIGTHQILPLIASLGWPGGRSPTPFTPTETVLIQAFSRSRSVLKKGLGKKVGMNNCRALFQLVMFGLFVSAHSWVESELMRAHSVIWWGVYFFWTVRLPFFLASFKFFFFSATPCENEHLFVGKCKTFFSSATSGCWSLVISYKMDTSKLLKSMQQQATQLVTPTFQRLSSDQDDFIMMRKQEKTLYLFYG